MVSRGQHLTLILRYKERYCFNSIEIEEFSTPLR